MFIIFLCIRLTLHGSLSFRSTPKALKIFFGEIPELNNVKIPSYTTVQRWAATVGYFKIKRPKVHADDWQIIIDLSIQMGTQKCLTILGCRQSDIKSGRALTLQDLEPIEVKIVSKVNSKVIKDILEAVTRKIGHIQVICSDEGSDVLAGVRLYQMQHPKTIHIPDIAHKMANFLKHQLKDDSVWQKFCSKASELKVKVQQTEFAAIAPPTQRSKARFMNADVLVNWAEKMLQLLDSPVHIKDMDIQTFEKHLSWLKEYRNVIKNYSRLIQVAALARHLVRTQGICTTTVEEFKSQSMLFDLNTDESQFVGKISNFLHDQAEKYPGANYFVGSSEILESFFGKFKSMEGDQCKSGFTGLALAAHAHIGPIDEETVAEALSSVTSKDVKNWIKTEVGLTLQAKRKRLFKFVKKYLNKNVEQKFSGDLEGEAMGF